MDKKFYRTTMIVGAILFIIGIILIFGTTNIGRELAYHAIQANGVQWIQKNTCLL